MGDLCVQVTSLITILLVQYTSTCMPMYRPGEPIPGTNQTSPPIRREWAVDKSLSDTDCEDGYFSDMAFLWLSNREDALKAVIMDPTAFSWQELSFPLSSIIYVEHQLLSFFPRKVIPLRVAAKRDGDQ